jgi:hypothetical protein
MNLKAARNMGPPPATPRSRFQGSPAGGQWLRGTERQHHKRHRGAGKIGTVGPPAAWSRSLCHRRGGLGGLGIGGRSLVIRRAGDTEHLLFRWLAKPRNARGQSECYPVSITQMKATALLFSVLFLVGGIGVDYCFGQLLKRGYEVAPDDWERAGRPTWWTWKPPEMMLPQWYYNAPRWRWIWSGPPWVLTDHVSRSLHMWHRLLFILMLVAWVGGLIGVAVASNSK